MWIEISWINRNLTGLRSLPSRKCGLKLNSTDALVRTDFVTSLAEVWIEIPALDPPQILQSVTSLAEVWIEISDPEVTQTSAMRHFPRGSVD